MDDIVFCFIVMRCLDRSLVGLDRVSCCLDEQGTCES